MSHVFNPKENPVWLTHEQRALRILYLLSEVHKVIDGMPDMTTKQRLRRLTVAMRYNAKYPYGIPHPDFFER